MTAKYKLRITGECKQNMKLCKRRGLPMDELWTVVGKLLDGDNLKRSIMRISSLATAKDNGSVTSVLTGCSSGKYATKSLYLCY